jgi:prolipoprotein diacylglyceryltransferase
VITLQFDPTVDIAGRPIRWETIALAAIIVVALILAGLRAGRANRRTDDPALVRLRRDDLLYIVVGALPGAIIGGRLLHGLDFLDYYLRVSQPSALLDPARGTLSLLGAVVGGTVTALYVGWLIGAPLRRWLDVAIVPLLLGIGLGKLAEVLGGGGQGTVTDVPWALSFAGGGPWRSLGADLPAHPSQVYEGAWALLGLLVVGVFTVPAVWRALPDELRNRSGVTITERERARANVDVVEDRPLADGAAPGLLFVAGLAWFALGRVVIGFTWRDEPVVAGLGMEQLAAVALLLVIAALLVRSLWPSRE